MGEGAYGAVYKVFSKKTNHYFAAKIVKTVENDDEGVPYTTIR